MGYLVLLLVKKDVPFTVIIVHDSSVCSESHLPKRLDLQLSYEPFSHLLEARGRNFFNSHISYRNLKMIYLTPRLGMKISKFKFRNFNFPSTRLLAGKGISLPRNCDSSEIWVKSIQLCARFHCRLIPTSSTFIIHGSGRRRRKKNVLPVKPFSPCYCSKPVTM